MPTNDAAFWMIFGKRSALIEEQRKLEYNILHKQFDRRNLRIAKARLEVLANDIHYANRDMRKLLSGKPQTKKSLWKKIFR